MKDYIESTIDLHRQDEEGLPEEQRSHVVSKFLIRKDCILWVHEMPEAPKTCKLLISSGDFVVINSPYREIVEMLRAYTLTPGYVRPGPNVAPEHPAKPESKETIAPGIGPVKCKSCGGARFKEGRCLDCGAKE